jgi:hypothetical protein
MIDTDLLSRDLNELGVDDDAVQRLIRFDVSAALRVRRRHRASIASGVVVAGCAAAGLAWFGLGSSPDTGTADSSGPGPVASSPGPVTLQIAADGGLRAPVSVGNAVTLLPAEKAQQPQSPAVVALQADADSPSPMTGAFRVFYARVDDQHGSQTRSVWVLLEPGNQSTPSAPRSAISAGRAAQALQKQTGTYQGVVTVKLVDGSHIVETETGILRDT